MYVGNVDNQNGSSGGPTAIEKRVEANGLRAEESLSVAEKRIIFERLSKNGPHLHKNGVSQQQPPPKPARTFRHDHYLQPSAVSSPSKEAPAKPLEAPTCAKSHSQAKPTATKRHKRRAGSTRSGTPSPAVHGVSHEYEHIFGHRSPMVLRQRYLRRSLSDDPVVYAASMPLHVLTSDPDVAPIHYACSPVPPPSTTSEDGSIQEEPSASANGCDTNRVKFVKLHRRARDSLPLNRERSEDQEESCDEDSVTGCLSTAVEKRVSRARMMRRRTLMHYDQQEIAFVKRRSPQLFEFAALVRLEANDGSNPMLPPEQKYAPTVVYRFPPRVKNGLVDSGSIMASLSCLCYPDISKAVLMSSDAYKDEQFVMTMTDQHGDRKFAYCYRFAPNVIDKSNEKTSPTGKLVRIITQNPCSSHFADETMLRELPRVLCVVTPVRANNFYIDFVKEAALKAKYSRGNQNADNDHDDMNHFLQEAFRKPLPSPGGRLIVSGPWGKDISVTHRISSSRETACGLSAVVERVGIDHAILLFTALLSERRVLLVGESVPAVSKAVQAAASLLMPFDWPHTFVPVVPDPYVNLCFSPTPYLMGLLRSNLHFLKDLLVGPRSASGGSQEAEDEDEECLLILDLDYGILKDKDFSYDSQGHSGSTTVVHRCLPIRTARILKQHLRSALSASLDGGVGTTGLADMKDGKVADAFLTAFVDLMGHYREFLVTQQDGQVTFQKQQFVNDAATASQRSFLKWFVETGMFQVWLKKKLDSAALAGAGGALRRSVTLGAIAAADPFDRKLDQVKLRQNRGNAAYRLLMNTVIKRWTSFLRRHNE